MKILVSGQKYFGQKVLELLDKKEGVEVVAVSAPAVHKNGKPDRLYELAGKKGLPVIPSGTLCEATMPDGVDLILCANHVSEHVSHRVLRQFLSGQSLRAKRRRPRIVLGHRPELAAVRQTIYAAIADMSDHGTVAIDEQADKGRAHARVVAVAFGGAEYAPVRKMNARA